MSAKRKTIILISVAAVILLVILHIVINVDPIIEQVSEKEVQALADKAINQACDETLGEFSSADMVEYVMSGDGVLQMVKTNTALMNLVSRKAIDASQERIESLGKQGVPIPLGALSGITIFAGNGPDVYIRVFPIGSVNASFNSEFISAGINQTRHRIILSVRADIRVVMPGANNVVATETEILLCENVIIGKVPDAYFNMHDLSDVLDLVP